VPPPEPNHELSTLEFDMTFPMGYSVYKRINGATMALYEECIVFLLAKAYQRAYGDFKRRLQPHGLTPVQHLILEVLWEEEGLSAGEIGRRVLLDNATLSGVLDRMAEGGWIQKMVDSDDKRVVRVRLTEKAVGLKETLQAQREAANQEILACLGPQQRRHLKELLRHIQGAASG